MNFKYPKSILITTLLIFIFGIIHLGVGIGIVAKYKKYGDIFVQSVGLCGFNIVIAIFAIFGSLFGLFIILTERQAMYKIFAVIALVLSVFTIASCIAGLGLNSQSISYVKDTLTDDMNRYSSDEGSLQVVDSVQTDFECCGVNLWLDWGRVSLGITNGKRSLKERRESKIDQDGMKTLIRALRQRRQTPINTIYNLPSSYTINLPLSCCKSGGTSFGNTLGGYCLFNASSSGDTFYLDGCLGPVGDRIVSQITGVVFINTCLVSLLCILILLVMKKIRQENINPNNPQTKQLQQMTIVQDQEQQPYNGQQYYSQPYYDQSNYDQSNYDPSYYDPQYGMNNNDVSYMYNPPTYAVYT